MFEIRLPSRRGSGGTGISVFNGMAVATVPNANVAVRMKALSKERFIKIPSECVFAGVFI
jgi:hypothetical protein